MKSTIVTLDVNFFNSVGAVIFNNNFNVNK